MTHESLALSGKKNLKDKKLFLGLVIILLLAGFLRLFNLTKQDMAGDDSPNSFRSIDYFDWMAAGNTQSTPVDWFEEKQWWQLLSFHDHPPVNFIIQFIFFKIFGVNVFAARLPFVMAGLFSVLFIYLLASKLFDKEAGLLSAAIMAVMNYHVWISRIGYIESLVIFFILASLYCFVHAGGNKKYYLVWGLFLGLGIATKYTILFIMPVYFFYLLFFSRKEFLNKYLYLGILIILIILYPIIIYNIMVFIERGHFDAALSSIIGMHPLDYNIIMNRKPYTGNVLGPLTTMRDFLSIPFLAILSFSAIFALIFGIKSKKIRHGLGLVILYLFFSFLMLYLLQGGHFTPIIIPAIVLLVSVAMVNIFYLLKKCKLINNIFLGFMFLFIIYEAFFSFNTQCVVNAAGNNSLFYARQMPVYSGYHQLDEYLDEILKKDKYLDSFITFYETPQVIAKQEKIFGKRSVAQNKIKSDIPIFIYDDRISWFAEIWLFERRKLYDQRIMGTIVSYLDALEVNGYDFFKSLGFNKVYFIFAKNKLVITDRYQDRGEKIDLIISKMYNGLPVIGAKLVKEIKNSFGELVFEIYELEL